MREMIVDIDNSESVQALLGKICESWFDPKQLYFDLKANGKTNSPDFWGINHLLFTEISNYLGMTLGEFLNIWTQKCSTYNVRIMGYHCTRHSNKKVFIEKGVLPLSNETIKIIEDKQNTETKRIWERRSQGSPGPYFLLNYSDAKSSGNHFLIYGPEILLACAGYQVNFDPAKSTPLIIHCAIPYSILPDKDYYTFCILRAYFNSIDPEDGSNNLPEGYSIDLKGTALDSQYIVRVEEILP
jgi:hypothetical protein